MLFLFCSSLIVDGTSDIRPLPLFGKDEAGCTVWEEEHSAC
jgi:hypothetical protein